MKLNRQDHHYQHMVGKNMSHRQLQQQRYSYKLKDQYIPVGHQRMNNLPDKRH
jgi:allantoicase